MEDVKLARPLFAIKLANFWITEDNKPMYEMEVMTSSKEGYKIIKGESTDDLAKGLFELTRNFVMRDGL